MRRIAIAGILLLISPGVYSFENRTVAVSEFGGKNLSAVETSIVSDFVRTALVKKKDLKVVNKSNMDIVLAEQGFQQNGCTETDCAVKIGKILNVKEIVIGSVSKFEGNYFLNMNLVDVETGQILESENGDAPSVRELKNVCEKQALRLFDGKSPRVKLTQTVYIKEEGILKIMFDMAAEHKASGDVNGRSISNTEDVEQGLSLSGEYVSYIDRNLGLGFGAIFQVPRKFKDLNGKFNFYPIYMLAKLRTSPDELSYKYLLAHLGYNMFYGDSVYKGSNSTLTGGLYYGAGAGIRIRKIQLELLYSVNKGSVKQILYSGGNTHNLEADVEYPKLSLTLGFFFN